MQPAPAIALHVPSTLRVSHCQNSPSQAPPITSAMQSVEFELSVQSITPFGSSPTQCSKTPLPSGGLFTRSSGISGIIPTSDSWHTP